MIQSLAMSLWSKAEPVGACLQWQRATQRGGYGVLVFQQRRFAAHRLSWALVHNAGEYPDPSVVIRHKCDNPACINPEHLEAGTHKDNVHDAIRRGRSSRGVKHSAALLGKTTPVAPARGQDNGNSKLTQDTADEIRRMYRTGQYSQQSLADRFGCDQTNISSIVRNKTWVVS